jgi:WD40 repeat protein
VDFASGAELARASPMPPGSLFGVAFNPRGGATLAVVTAASDTTNTSSLVVLDAETLVIKGTPLYAHSHDAFALAYSLSGRYLVTGGEDAIVRVRDLRGDGVTRPHDRPWRWRC